MSDLTPDAARAFLAALTVLSRQHGVALMAELDGEHMVLEKADITGSYEFVEGNFLDASVVFDQIKWVEPTG
jgi:hypothetical protein